MADPRVIPLHSPGQGVQFSPFGFTSLDESRPQVQSVEALGGSMPAPEQDAAPPAPRVPVKYDIATDGEPMFARSLPPPSPIVIAKPGSVVKAAKARIKELRAFLKQASRAEKELRELERLVAAAKKPLAPVRDIKRSAG